MCRDYFFRVREIGRLRAPQLRKNHMTALAAVDPLIFGYIVITQYKFDCACRSEGGGGLTNTKQSFFARIGALTAAFINPTALLCP